MCIEIKILLWTIIIFLPIGSFIYLFNLINIIANQIIIEPQPIMVLNFTIIILLMWYIALIQLLKK